jgi:hypothetical protein
LIIHTNVLLIRTISCWNNSMHYQAFYCFHVLREMLCRWNICHTLQVTTKPKKNLATLKWSKSKFGSTQPHRCQSISKIWHGMFWIVVFLYDPEIMKKCGMSLFSWNCDKSAGQFNKISCGASQISCGFNPQIRGEKNSLACVLVYEYLCFIILKPVYY